MLAERVGERSFKYRLGFEYFELQRFARFLNKNTVSLR